MDYYDDIPLCICTCEFFGQDRKVEFHHMNCYIWRLAGMLDGFYVSAAYVDQYHRVHLYDAIKLDKEEE